LIEKICSCRFGFPLLGWWHWPSVCCGGPRCFWFCVDCWKRSVWRVRTITCTRNIRLSPRPQGLPCSMFFYLCIRTCTVGSSLFYHDCYFRCLELSELKGYFQLVLHWLWLARYDCSLTKIIYTRVVIAISGVKHFQQRAVW